MRLLLNSSSNVHGYGYLDHLEPFLLGFLEGRHRVAFIPFAAHDHDAYTATVRERLAKIDIDVVPLSEAEAIFVGGGNTFRLLKTLIERDLLDRLRSLARDGMPYIGSSAGTVIAAPAIKTTNDMPIVQPPTFDALALVRFQINCHYLDPDPSSTHKGETREQRIREFHEENAAPVVGLREGSMLRVENGITTLLGTKGARIFRQGVEPVEAAPGTVLGELV